MKIFSTIMIFIGMVLFLQLGFAAPNGTPCDTTGPQCDSGFCVDGVCCESKCGGGNQDCQACNLVRSLGDCLPVGAGVECRAANDLCDSAEACDGTSRKCPQNIYLPVGTVCRPAVGLCDLADTCTGQSSKCEGDKVLPEKTECRAAIGECDIAELCDGKGKKCPRDIYQQEGKACGDQNMTTCTEPDTCNRSGSCEENHVPDGTLCEDEFFCTEEDRCEEGECKAGEIEKCSAELKCLEQELRCIIPCGDGILDEGEACDRGDRNSNESGAKCRLDCKLARCGDGIIDPGEACDEESTTCSQDCQFIGIADMGSDLSDMPDLIEDVHIEKDIQISDLKMEDKSDAPFLHLQGGCSNIPGYQNQNPLVFIFLGLLFLRRKRRI